MDYESILYVRKGSKPPKEEKYDSVSAEYFIDGISNLIILETYSNQMQLIN